MTDRRLPTLKPRTYPLDAPADDPRFTFGLALDVAAVLTKHGYPELASGLDIVALEQALFAFLYRPVSANLGNTVEYGHDRIDHGDATTPVPATVDGHAEFTGRATVPDTSCLAVLPSGMRCDEPIFWNPSAYAWWHEHTGHYGHTATGPSVPPVGSE